MLATQPKTFDKRDRAIKAAVAALGADAKEGADFELTKTEDKRFVWAKLNQPAYQPSAKDRVYNTNATVDGVLRPDIHGTVLVVGPTVSEVKWDKPAPWGQLQNCLNRHLQPVDNGIPGFLKVENRKPLSPEKKAALDKRMEEAKAVRPAAEAQCDFTLPKNVEPAGLEILAASGLSRKKAAIQSNGEAPSSSSRGRRKGDGGKWTLRTTYDLFNSLAPQAKLEQRKGKTGFLDRKTAHKVLSLLQGELTKAKVNPPADLKEALQAMQP